MVFATPVIRPAILCGRVLVFLTEQFPRYKDGLGLAFSGRFHVHFAWSRRHECSVYSFRPPQFSPSPIRQRPQRNPRESVRRGSLASGRTGEFDEYSLFRLIAIWSLCERADFGTHISVRVNPRLLLPTTCFLDKAPCVSSLCPPVQLFDFRRILWGRWTNVVRSWSRAVSAV